MCGNKNGDISRSGKLTLIVCFQTLHNESITVIGVPSYTIGTAFKNLAPTLPTV